MSSGIASPISHPAARRASLYCCFIIVRAVPGVYLNETQLADWQPGKKLEVIAIRMSSCLPISRLRFDTTIGP